MSEQITDEPTDAAETIPIDTPTDNPSTDPPKTSPVDAIKRDAQEKISEAHSSGAIRGKVVQTLVDAEVDRRSQLLLKAYETARKTQEDLAKCKPDHCVHIKGERVEGYSDARQKERQKLEALLAKQTAAISRAIESADYAGLEKLAG
jgi:hypothetical protein